MKSCIALIGLPGCGKSTLGRGLAERLALPFVDADEVVARLAGESIPDLFARGEACFRDWETLALREALRGRAVVACGGGAVLRPENVYLLRERALVIFIDRPAAQIAGDVDASTRPLLAAGADRVYQLHAQRDALYRAAAHVIIANDEGPEAALNAMLRALGRGGEET